MHKFGESIILRNNAGFLGKIKFNLFGIIDSGHFLRSSYFRKYLNSQPLKKKFGKEQVLTILDAGCGNGDYSFYLAQRYPNSHIDAIDLNVDILLENRQVQKGLRISNINFLKENLINLDVKDKYDFVFCIGVIIYMSYQENELIFNNLFRSLKKGASMYLYLAHRQWENSLIINRRFYKRMYEQAKQQNRGSLYDETGLALLLAKAGFRIIKQKISGGFWGELGWEIDQILKENRLERMRLLIAPIIKIISLIDIFVSNKKGTGMIFVLEKS